MKKLVFIATFVLSMRICASDSLLEICPQPIIDFFFEYSDINEKFPSTGKTRFIWGAIQGNTHLLELLIAQGAKIDLQDAQGKTALMFAVINGDFETVDFLVDQMANLHLQDNDGKTALDHAKDQEKYWWNYFFPQVRKIRILLEGPAFKRKKELDWISYRA